MIDMSGHDPSGPLSWRDVYRAVNDSETRIIKSINDAVAPVANQGEDHEVRIRNLEIEGSAVSRHLVAAVENHGARLTSLEGTREVSDARKAGIFSAFSNTQKFIITLAAICGSVIAVLDLISRVVS